MLKPILLPAVLGFAWGLAVSLFNNFWTARALKDPKKSAAVIFFTCRQLINVLAMFAVYKNLPMLIGTALGLLAVKNYILIQGFFDLNKQQKEYKEKKRKG